MYILGQNSELIKKKKKKLSCFILQRVSEKVGGAEGTKLDEDFMEMEKVSFLHQELFSFKKHSSEHLVVYETFLILEGLIRSS